MVSLLPVKIRMAKNKNLTKMSEVVIDIIRSAVPLHIIERLDGRYRSILN